MGIEQMSMEEKQQKEYKVTLDQDDYKILENLSDFFDIAVDDLVSMAIKDLAELVTKDPQIFLEKIGFIHKLKNFIND